MRSAGGIIRRPRILVPGQQPTNRGLKLPKAPPRSEEIIRVGPCLACGDSFNGPRAVRLTVGYVNYPKIGKSGVDNLRSAFEPEVWEDGDDHKFLCPTCAYEHGVLDEDTAQFTEELGELCTGWCCLCHEAIDPWPQDDYSSAVLIERGEVKRVPWKPSSAVCDGLEFEPHFGGTVHYMCMDDLGLELWRMVQPSDEPDQ